MLLVGVRGAGGIVPEEVFGRIERRVVKFWGGLVNPASGPFEELFKHSELNEMRDRICSGEAMTREEGCL